MKVKLIIMGLMVCLSITLPSSSFFLSDYLTQLIISNKNSQEQFDFALTKNNKAALLHLWKTTKQHSDTWLVLAKKLAKTQGEAAYQLAAFYQAQKANKQAVSWYQRSIRLNFPPAFIGLSQYYFDQDDLTTSANILAQLPAVQDDATIIAAQILSINLAINMGNISAVQNSLDQYKPLLMQNKQGMLLLDNIRKYRVIPSQEIFAKNTLSCSHSIQFFATRLDHLAHLENLIAGFKESALSDYLCFSPVRYIPINLLACTSSPSQAIQCNEQFLQNYTDSIAARFVGVLVPEGGANVHFGVLYLDASDNVDVFVHEVSHLLGFVDEYPLVKNHIKCQQTQDQAFSENIAILAKHYQGKRSDIRAKVLAQLAWASAIKNTTPILQQVTKTANSKQQVWQLGTSKEFEHEVGVFHAQTCDNSIAAISHRAPTLSFTAFKAIAKSTKLQYYTLDFPVEYLSFIEAQPDRFLMPSFHYNIALANRQEADLKKLKQLATKENKKTRQNITAEKTLKY